MIINDTYSIEHDGRQWILTTLTGVVTREGSANLGKPTYSTRFYATLEQVSRIIILDGMDTSNTNNINNLINTINTNTQLLCTTLKEKSNEI